jgi:general secretion pathway protein A
MRQLAQRITARYHLPPLKRQETIAYIDHRLSVAGSRAGRLFTQPALGSIYRRSGGVPRLINVICDRALLGAYVRGKQRVDLRILNQAAREVLPARIPGRTLANTPWWSLASAVAVALAVGLGIRPASIEPVAPVTPAVQSSSALSALVPAEQTQTASQETVEQATALVSAAAADAPAGAVETAFEPSPVALAEIPEPPPADLAGLLAASAGASDAMSRLLRLWGEQLQVAPGSYPCEQIRQLNLRCLSGQADWQTLRAYNRPAIIPLVAAGGETRQVLLRSLVDDDAVLDFGRHPIRTRIDQLDPLWTGEFLLLWRPPVDQELIGPGSSGAAVVWLRRQLWFAENGVLPSGDVADRFDDELGQMVRRFQRSNNLDVDGLVGSRTLLLINSIAPAAGTPLLNVPAVTRIQG